MSDRKENLAKNTVLFAIGSLGSKLLQIILVPFYTRVMADEEFGTTDILQAIVSLLLPIFSLAIYESVFRYAMETEYDRRSVFSTGFVITLAGSAALGIAAVALGLLTDVRYITLVVLNTILNAFRSLYSQYARAINRSVLFTVDNLLLTGCVLFFNILFISVCKLGITGYMLGYIAANAVSTIFLCIMLGNDAAVRLKSISRGIMKTMLLFSIPLIPNAICWWISSFTDRIMITSMVSVSANGLYAAAHKIPSLLSMVVTIFFQAWQISANEEFKKKDIADFYSEIFEQISACVFVLSSLLIILCEPITSVFLGSDYYVAWEYMPVLLLSMTFFSFAQFLGSIYSANKKTSMAFITNLIAMIVNVVCNYFFIKLWGTLGAGIATALSYLVLWLVRTLNTHSIVSVRYKIVPMILSTVIVIAQAAAITYMPHTAAVYSLCAVGCAAVILLNIKALISLADFGLSLIKKLIKRS